MAGNKRARRRNNAWPAFLAAFLFLLVGGCSSIRSSELLDSAPSDFVVYVVDRGWHTDIGLPVEELRDPLADVAKDFPGASYLVFGFGDRNYLVNREASVLDLMRALLPGRGVLLVTGLKASPAIAFGKANVVALRLSAPQLTALERFLTAYFATDGLGHPLAAGPYAGSLFYASDATYDGLHTCNTWVAEGLDAAGFPVSSAFVVFAPQVLTQARHIARVQAQSRPPATSAAAAAATALPPR